jgi:hypothetical protein
MLLRVVVVVLFAGLMPDVVYGQRPGQPAPQPAVQTPKGAPVEQPGPATGLRRRGRDVNLQLEFTISDQTGAAAADKKIVSMLVADATSGRIRTQQGTGISPTINVDARPQILDSGAILLELTIEYRPPAREDTKVSERPAVLNESLTVLLLNGKPQVISQASDPVTDRRLSIEVRASILK